MTKTSTDSAALSNQSGNHWSFFDCVRDATASPSGPPGSPDGFRRTAPFPITRSPPCNPPRISTTLPFSSPTVTSVARQSPAHPHKEESGAAHM